MCYIPDSLSADEVVRHDEAVTALNTVSVAPCRAGVGLAIFLEHAAEAEISEKSIVSDIGIEPQKLCSARLLAVELQLKRVDLDRIGAKTSNKNAANQKDNGGRYRDRTYDPTRVKGVLSR